MEVRACDLGQIDGGKKERLGRFALGRFAVVGISARLGPDCILVNVFLLRIVYAYERLD